MITREALLSQIRAGLDEGLITESDLQLFSASPTPLFAEPAVAAKPDKLSAVDIMFYIAGIIMFSTIMSIIVQSWDADSPFVNILLSAGVGVGLWSLAYYLIKSPLQNDIRKGLINALLLTGSLCVVVGGYIVSNELIGGFGDVNFISGAITLAAVGALHIYFDRMIKRDLTLIMGILLSVAAFPALIFGFLQEANVPADVWALVLIGSAGLLIYAARVVSKILPERSKIGTSFDSFAAFIALAAMYLSSFSEYGILWLSGLIAGIFGIFYLSIVAQNKRLLGSASFFMVVTVLTISFRYFSGFGVTTSLIIATIGLLGSAAVASSINKRYFKQ